MSDTNSIVVSVSEIQFGSRMRMLTNDYFFQVLVAETGKVLNVDFYSTSRKGWDKMILLHLVPVYLKKTQNIGVLTDF
jgi:hypothetical protein